MRSLNLFCLQAGVLEIMIHSSIGTLSCRFRPFCMIDMFVPPGQTLAPVFVTALTKITIFFYFLVPPLGPRFGTLKTSKRAEAGAQRMELFQKAE
jgi:hypothetical protein